MIIDSWIASHKSKIRGIVAQSQAKLAAGDEVGNLCWWVGARSGFPWGESAAFDSSLYPRVPKIRHHAIPVEGVLFHLPLLA